MTACLRVFHLSSLSVCAAFLLAFSQLAAHSQDTEAPVKDCTHPASRTPDVLADCARSHAQFLFADRCPGKQSCADAEVISAFQTASRLFDRYLMSRDGENGGPPKDKADQAFDTRWRAFFQERSHDYGNAFRNYRFCTQLAREASPRDTDDLNTCATALNRLNCVKSSTALCDGPREEATQSIQIGFASLGGGRTSSVSLDSVKAEEPADEDNPPAPPPQAKSNTSIATIKLPTSEEVAEMKKAMTHEEKQDLLDAIEEQNVTITSKP
jgi:hypothetical protein